MTATKSAAPNGWITAGSHPDSYEMSLFTEFSHSGTRCARLRSTRQIIDGFGTLMQSVNAAGYRGKRIKLTAFIKSESVNDWAGLWMRVDAGREFVSFDNMQNRAIRGDTDWTQYHVVLDVPEKSTNISFGVLLSGVGCLWLDDFELKVVGQEVPSTDTTVATLGWSVASTDSPPDATDAQKILTSAVDSVQASPEYATPPM